MDDIAVDGVDVAFSQDGQDWRVAWFPPPDPPPGTPHGAAAICVAGDQVVLIGTDGETWGLPGGRPEPGEAMIDTMRREVYEEACRGVRVPGDAERTVPAAPACLRRSRPRYRSRRRLEQSDPAACGSRFHRNRLSVAAWLDPVRRYRVHAGGVRTGEVAERAGVNVQTLRYYERRGLLPEPDRSVSGYRTYTTDAVRTVRFIKRAQQLGFSLDDIDELLHLASGGPDSCESVRSMAGARITDLDRRIAELQAMRSALDTLANTCDKPRGQRDCPILREIDRDIVPRKEPHDHV